MASNRTRRITKEIADIHADRHSQITVDPISEDDLTRLKGSFPGPPGTAYEGGTFKVDITIPTEYPFRPPVMKFDTRVWHPNISSQTVHLSITWDKRYVQYKEEIMLMECLLSRALSVWIHSHLPGHRF